jgi:hypothetical protein
MKARGNTISIPKNIKGSLTETSRPIDEQVWINIGILEPPEKRKEDGNRKDSLPNKISK